MKTKIIPFDIELAKKIQSGEIEGKMFVSDNTHNKIRIICFDRKAAFPKIVALEEDNVGVEWIRECNELGQFITSFGTSAEESDNTKVKGIILEVPDDETQLKPFDKVLVRDRYEDIWRCSLFSHKDENGYCTSGFYWRQCIPYKGNEHLLGTNDEPKEE